MGNIKLTTLLPPRFRPLFTSAGRFFTAMRRCDWSLFTARLLTQYDIKMGNEGLMPPSLPLMAEKHAFRASSG